MIPGFTARIAPSGIPVLKCFFYADPKKRPGTPDGDAWMAEAASGYPGGTASPRWRKEMLIEYSALSGTKLFPEWELWSTTTPIVCAPFVPTGYRLYASYDHGWNNPSAYHVHAIDSDGVITTLWEFYADKVPVTAIAKIIQGEAVTLAARPDARIEPGRLRFDGNPFAGQELWRIADPSIWAEDKPMVDEPNKSTEWIFRTQHGVVFQPGERGGDLTVAEWLLGSCWADPRVPRYRIATTCPWLIWELGRQRYKSIAPHRQLDMNVSESLIDKDNHGWDGLKMFLKRFVPKATVPKPAQVANTFAWWQKVARTAKTGRELPTFRRAMVS